MSGDGLTPIDVTPRAKVWLEVNGTYVFGLGVCRILQAVDQTGSIKEAAVVVGKSYRHVWARIKEVEQRLGIVLVETQVGGGNRRRSTLTEPARELASSYQEIRQQLFEMVEERFGTEIREIINRASRRDEN